MKTIVILVSASLSLSIAHAQKLAEKEVPANVKNAVLKKFPQAKIKQWEKENEQYEAELIWNKNEISVLLNPDGTILETETEIAVSELPAPVLAYVSKNYPKHKVKEAAKITDAKGTVTYEAEVNEKDLIFDHQGNFLKEKANASKDEDKD